MYDFQPYFTNDGSVGLYNNDFNDIYHSATGALTEAYEKFIYPLNFDNLLLHEDIKILDICYGTGYNTKSFLNFLFDNQKKLLKRKKFLKKNLKIKNSCNDDIVSIHTDNIQANNSQININSIYTNKDTEEKSQLYSEKIYANNIFDNISVTALDNDEILFGLSPFIKTGCKKFKNNKTIISDHHLSKYFKGSNKCYPKIKNCINFLIYQNIREKMGGIYDNESVKSVINASGNATYFTDDLRGVYNIFGTDIRSDIKHLNLHNIYYRYLSSRYKRQLKSLKIGSFNFEPKIDDARNSVIHDNNSYNLIFLDAFSPNKCPCLWSYEFFKQLYRLLADDGELLTYSSSACVRSAMIQAGFYIGYNYNKRLDKFDGTIAVKNKSLIKYPLSEFDIGLLKTTAGIFYRDENLNASNEAILNLRIEEVKESNRISSTKYKKLHQLPKIR